MNTTLWVLQILAAILYGSSGVMKVFMFDRISTQVPSFGALPKRAWNGLGLLELACTTGLIVPGVLHWRPELTAIAALLLSLESLVFIWVHARYREFASIAFSGVLGLLMGFIGYGRMVLSPLN